MKVGIIGTGVYGMAMAIQLTEKCDNVVMWSESLERVVEFNETHKITGILDGIEIPRNIKVTNSYEEVVRGANVVFILTVAKYVEEVCKNIKPYITSTTPICIASKGIIEETCEFLSDVVANTLDTDNIAVLSGPTFAIDMANDDPCALSIASKKDEVITKIKNVLSNDTVKLRETDDLIGVQICGSIKNVIALAAGMIDGMGYQESTRAFLITEALHDIKNFIVELGGNEKTILSYAGVGDLLLTCTSTKSRNYTLGKMIGTRATNMEIKEYKENNTIEGLYSVQSIYKLIKDKNIDMPIINLIYDIVINGKNPHLLSEFLINKK